LVKASVGNYFFVDTNVNGLQDAGDFGVNGVTVKLLDKDGRVIETTFTTSMTKATQVTTCSTTSTPAIT
jgi:hypothetical protein